MVFVLGSGITLALLNMVGKAFFWINKLHINVSVSTVRANFSSLAPVPSQPVDLLLSIFEIAIPISSTDNGGMESVLFWDVLSWQKLSSLLEQLHWDPSLWPSGRNLETTDTKWALKTKIVVYSTVAFVSVLIAFHMENISALLPAESSQYFFLASFTR